MKIHLLNLTFTSEISTVVGIADIPSVTDNLFFNFRGEGDIFTLLVETYNFDNAPKEYKNYFTPIDKAIQNLLEQELKGGFEFKRLGKFRYYIKPNQIPCDIKTQMHNDMFGSFINSFKQLIKLEQ